MSWLIDRLHPQTLRLLALIVVMALVIVFFGSVVDNYYNARMFTRVTTSVAIVLLIAAGQSLVVLTRNIDLSVGSIVGFTAYFVGDLLAGTPDLSPVLAVLVAVAVGGLFGVVNGLVVAYGRVPAIIVTLGTMALFRTLLVEYGEARSITTQSLPQWLVELPPVNLFELGGLQFRLTFVIAVVVVILVHLFLTRLRLGRKFYAVGSNPEAAVTAGINTRWIVFLAFVLCGALAGLAGFLYLAKFGNITVTAGLQLELKSVAAVVVGGVNIFGGSGSAIGVLLGAILVDLIDNSLVRWELISEFWRDAVLGLMILLAVAADSFLLRRLVFVRQRRAAARQAAAEAAADPTTRAGGRPATTREGG
ncbi:MAG: ABC transporter permease [Alphaproteobacteria bacterium]